MKKYRSWIRLLCLLLALLVFSSCAVGGGWNQVEEDKNIKIGVSFSYSGNMTFIEMVKAMERRADELGNVELIVAYSEMDPVKIISDIETFINAGCDAIIVQNFDVVACEAVLKEAKEAGIYVITYDEVSQYADMSLLVDNEALGELIGSMACEWIQKNLDGSAKVGVISISNYAYLETRMDAATEIVKDLCPDSEVVARESSYTVDAVDTVENMLQAEPELSVILTYHDNNGLFAVEAMKVAAEANGWDTSKRAVFGSDCTPAGLQAIADGGMYRGSVFLDNNGKIVELLDCAIGMVQGKTYSFDKIYFDMVPVTIENVHEYLKTEEN